MSDLQKTEQIVLIGCGAMAMETAAYIADVNEAAANESWSPFELHGVVAGSFERQKDIEALVGHKIETYEREEDIADYQNKKYVICIGSNTVVFKYVELFKERGLALQTVIHPAAYISKTATLEDGVIVAPHAYVGPAARVGRGTIINVSGTIGHDCVLGDACIVSPHVDLNGGVEAGNGVFFGAGVTIDPTVKIGKFAKVVSGATVRKDVKEGHLLMTEDKPTIKMFNTTTGANLFKR